MLNVVSQAIKNLWPKAKSYPSDDEELRTMIKANGLNHIAILPDGHRRWAKKKNISFLDSYNVAVERMIPLFRYMWEDLNIHTITLSGFIPENWKRDKDEIDAIFESAKNFIMNLYPLARDLKVKIIHLGRKDRLPEPLNDKIKYIEDETAQYSNFILNIGIDYGGIDEVSRAIAKILQAGINYENLTEDLIFENLDTSNQPHPRPDIIIRAAGTQRLSGFMPLQSVYSEIYFVKQYFPDFDRKCLNNVIREFCIRDCKFGK